MHRNSRRKAGGRPYKPGQSGNPNGRPKKSPEQRAVEIDARHYARGFGREAVDRAVELMRGKVEVNLGTEEEPKIVKARVSSSTMLSACEFIVDRGYGRPQQSMDVNTTIRNIDEEAAAARAYILSQLASIAERERETAGGGRAH
jgi:hypothetical protein